MVQPMINCIFCLMVDYYNFLMLFRSAFSPHNVLMLLSLRLFPRKILREYNRGNH